MYDPTPTRPVLRSELQGETGAWPVDPAAAWSPTAAVDPANADQDGSVVDLAEMRRKRTGDDDPAVGNRRLPKPRRIGEGSSGDGEDDRNQDDCSDSPPAGKRTGRHRK
ncbi:hypothetical protein ACFXNW_26515 [Nocardia sp. NPDC059180]|uniref:hypothetical protein n=1 Tax=Nocardia sp. NPDC059180 TaxID=3346761 RepID=UPI0036A10962